MKEINFKNSVEYLNKLRSTFYIMVGIPLVLFLLIYLVFRENMYTAIYPEMPTAIIKILAALFVIAAILSFIYYFRELPQVRNRKTLKEKLAQYYRLCNYKFGMLLIISMLNLICYFLSGHVLLAGVYILLLIMFALNNPSYYNVVGNLKLRKEEREIMKNNSIIA
ncbi:MAG: hypothetical protein AAGI07_03580 [Bacteroidota bacterium]